MDADFEHYGVSIAALFFRPFCLPFFAIKKAETDVIDMIEQRIELPSQRRHLEHDAHAQPVGQRLAATFRALQLEVEESALKNEKDDGSKARLGVLRKELTERGRLLVKKPGKFRWDEKGRPQIETPMPPETASRGSTPRRCRLDRLAM